MVRKKRLGEIKNKMPKKFSKICGAELLVIKITTKSFFTKVLAKIFV